jgi:hypothetical protein
MSGAAWKKRRVQWNASIEEFERLWARWTDEKRVKQMHFQIEDEIYAQWMHMMHAAIVPHLVEPAIDALRGHVERFRVELERDASRRGRRSQPFHASRMTFTCPNTFLTTS